MIGIIKSKTPYGDVIVDKLHLKNARTFRYIVSELSSVSFSDSSLDSKGAAFEYFVRATLKGKKLGQYFTPRPVVRLMNVLIGEKKIFSSVLSGETIKVLDPACGTGGFLVFLMQDALARADLARQSKALTVSAHKSLTEKLMQNTFFGADANEGVACAAKMNMIVAGDGHTNIRPEDSLAAAAKSWDVATPDCDIIITNPPFGTSETDSLEKGDWDQFPFRLTKGQQLFLQKMLLSVKPGGDICTVIDDGLLNTASSQDLRKWLFQNARMKVVVRLPEDTFKPNKINVRSSVLLMEKWDAPDTDLDNDYSVIFIDVKSLGYYGSGEPIRGFDLDSLLHQIESSALGLKPGQSASGPDWDAFTVSMADIKADALFRLDLKYWMPGIRARVEALEAANAISLAALNTVTTRRGRSPKAEDYVDEKDGFAAVIKAGTCITKYGQIVLGDDFIEKDIFDEMPDVQIQKGDILIASTGTGTLGKAGVYQLDWPAIADGHVTIIRPEPEKIDPHYLADYLRAGPGAAQIERLYTGSTGLIELTPEDVDRILIDTLNDDLKKQKGISDQLRQAENKFLSEIQGAEAALMNARSLFSGK